jgi:GH18 family chitinase
MSNRSQLEPKRLIGYFIASSIHATKYSVADIPADQLTHVIYAFAGVSTSGECASVNNVDDSINFPQLLQLKQGHPKLSTLIAIGGTKSNHFTSAARNEESREKFANSCVHFMKHHGFDGIDIDWEYPNGSDKGKFTALLSELRHQLNAQGAKDNRQYLLTIAAPAGPSRYANIDLIRIHSLLDWINLMSYDFTVVSSKDTDFVAPLMAYDVTVSEKHATANVDSAVRAYLQAGVPANKLVVGTRFFGTGWAGVPNINNGLYQISTGPVRGTWDDSGSAPTGSFGYQDLKENYIGSDQRFWHPAAQVPWLYQPGPSGAPGVMISYEDPQSLTAKTNYVLSTELGGMMIWALSADDGQHTLVTTLADGLGLNNISANGSTSFLISGTVTQPDGTPARGLSVTAYDQGMRMRQSLGRGRTGPDGSYRIPYSAPAHQSGAEGGLDLVVEVRDSYQEVLTTSDVLFNAPTLATIDVTLAQTGAEAEYDRVVRVLTPVLNGQGVTLDTLEQNKQYQDLSFANGETGIAMAQLRAFAVARRLQNQNQLPAQFWFAVLATNTITVPSLPQDTTSIDALTAAGLALVPNTPSATVLVGLDKAVSKNLISQPTADQLQTWQKQYSALMASEALKPGSSSIAGPILDASGVPQAKRDTLLGAYLAGGNRNDIVQRVRDTNQFTPKEIDAISATLTIRDLTFGDAKLIANFAGTITTQSSAISLARMSVADWQRAITQAGSTTPDFVGGDASAAKIANYATLLSKRAALTYPTGAFAGDLSRALSSPAPPAFSSGATMLEFLTAHPEFELATTSIDGFLAKNASPAFFNAAATSTQFVQDLKAAQRVFKVAPNFTATNRLVQDGLHSAQQIYKLGKAQFVKKYANLPGFTASSVQDIYERAASTHAATLTLVGHLRSVQSANGIQALANPVSALDNFPNLQNLFGHIDSCDCDDCQSIFGPAAYLTDLLHYLEGRLLTLPLPPPPPSPPPQAATVKDIFTNRRPDIGYIELSCGNSDTPVLYIDLACEVMEDRVAPWTLFTLLLALQSHLTEGPPDATLAAAFEAANPSVVFSPLARVSAQDEFGNWVIHDTAQTYLVQKQAGGLAVSISRQTHLTADELSAYPEYTNSNAYSVLSTAPFPLALPFDLYTEEVRAYLATMNIQRATLMEAFRGPSAPNNPQDLDIAAEYMGIAKFEQALIFTADPPHQFKYWGTSDNVSAISQMSKVNVFLNTTGLAFTDLQKFLTLSFVNPGGAIVIQNLDSSCDLTQKLLQVLDANALDRFHRFLRLWRKLRWQMWEVDLVIQHPAIGNGSLDATFALKLYPFMRIKDKLGNLSVEQLCGFWGNLNTTAKFTAAYQAPDPSLYETLFLNKKLTNPLDPAFAISAVTAAAPSKHLDDDIAPILAATKTKQTDLAILEGLTQAANGPAYIDGLLSLKNLSFLYRHALLARTLRIKIPAWQTLLFLFQQDVFKDSATTWAFLELWDRIKSSNFSIDQLNYILSADLTAKSAVADKSIASVLAALQKSLQAISMAANSATLPTTADGLSAAIATQLQTLGWDAASVVSLVNVFTNQTQQQRLVQGVPAGFTFPAAITGTPNPIPVGFDQKTNSIRFTGVMTDAQKIKLTTDPSLAAVTANPSYQSAITDLYDTPRLLLKFYYPFFTTPLATLSSGVQFGALAAPLSSKISYDTNLNQLTFMGIMSTDDRTALSALAAGDLAYQAAMQSLFHQPRTAVTSAAEQWLTLADLATPLQPNAVANLIYAELGSPLPTAGSGTIEGLNAYVVRKLSTDQVIQQLATGLGLTQAIVNYLITTFPIFGTGAKHALLVSFLDPAFVNASAAITADAFPEIYQGYRWLHRIALIGQILGLNYTDLQWIINDQPATDVLDFTNLPLVNGPNLIPSPVAQLTDLADLIRLHHSLSLPDLTLLNIIDKLIHPPVAGYNNTQFAADIAVLTEWNASDIAWLTTGNVAQVFPASYKTAAGWLWISQAFGMIQQIGATAQTTASWATPVVHDSDSVALKQTLRGQFDEARYLSLSKPIQDNLRQRKRDSLVAYLLTQPMPSDNPTGKWTDPEDLFAYYLIDVQMDSCQPSSRIVQASASVQLLVQRCFMGLEPLVRVSVDNDSGWNDWSWMKYYRVWEANRMVFAYPENYCEPELRKNKSEIFTSLQSELQQNELTSDNVETVFEHYLDTLDNMSKLEVSGMFYQESNQTLHVFGNTSANPPLYYYRQFIDGRRWTAWSKVDCDIKANYVVPLVNDERLYIVWPEFQSQASPPSSAKLPSQTDQSNGTMNVEPPKKDRLMYIAISEFKSGKWTPKKVSTDAVDLGEWTDKQFDKDDYFIVPADLTWLPDALFPPPAKRPLKMPTGYQWLLDGAFLLQPMQWTTFNQGAQPVGQIFELAGCKGYPEPFDGQLTLDPLVPVFYEAYLSDGHNIETDDATTLTPAFLNNPFPSLEILGNTPSAFDICYPNSLSWFDKLGFLSLLLGLSRSGDGSFAEKPRVTLGTFYDWFYGDKLRCFFVRPELYSVPQREPKIYIQPSQSSQSPVKRLYYQDIIAFIEELKTLIAQKNWSEFLKILLAFIEADYRYALHFFTFFHPLVCMFAKTLYEKDVEGLMARETQFGDRGLDFGGTYEPTTLVDPDYPQEIVDFDPTASYSIYNWELFYFAPMYIAEQFSTNQQFDEAMRWYHFIFDPTGSHDTDPLTGNPATAPQKYWITKPFYLRQQTGTDGYFAESLDNLMNMLASDPTNPSSNPEVAALQAQVADWRQNPFDPHIVAQYRTVAYQKFAVMKYLDNLIAGGDSYFRMDTLESVNIATQWYICAAEILGTRLQKVPPPAKPLPLTFNELDPQLDAFSNALITVENLIPAMPVGNGYGPPPPPLPTTVLYFCIPQNAQLLSYWDTVEDRLFKIRHCLNIEGVFNPPALFAPPINPMALVEAAAAGLDISSALADLESPLPYYRFSTMIQKANEFNNDVKSLGAALLAALEKNDAEGLALLRQTQEISLLQAVRNVKQRQIDDAQAVLDGLNKNLELVTIRRDYYASREFMNVGEGIAQGLSGLGLLAQGGAIVADVLAGVMFLIPNFHVGAAGFGGSPQIHVSEGGTNTGKGAERGANGLYQIAQSLDWGGRIAATLAGYQRRMDDWQNQLNLANKELEQISKQIASAQAKLDIANMDLANQDLQISNAQAVNQFMLSKYTNKDLYQWLIGQISQTYFQSYQLAFAMAKRAERCYRFEIGVDDSNIIQFGYWDSLKKGLHAGERLQLDLRRLENTYLDQNRREFECTKHVSLALSIPLALIQLRNNGICTFSLAEELFDLDYPGHYFRRIKSVSFSIPCVAGPNTTVSATLRLLKNMIRTNSQLGSQYVHNQDDSGVFTDDPRFRESSIRVNAIAASSAQNDIGMFELNFRDERYLPFEGAGAISTWQLELTQDIQLRQFNYDTISDVILHLRYTSREDVGQFRGTAVSHLKNDVLGTVSPQLPLYRLFDLMHEFPTEWYAFLHPGAAQPETLQINITAQMFPFIAQSRSIEIKGFSLWARTISSVASLACQIDPGTGGGSIFQPNFTTAGNGFRVAQQDGGLVLTFDPTQAWVVQIGTSPGQFNTLTDGDVLDCYLLVEYTLQ